MSSNNLHHSQDMSSFFNLLLYTLFPRYCLLCRKSGLSDELLCTDCLQDLPYHRAHQCRQCAILLPNSQTDYCGNCLKKSPAFDQVFALFSYIEPITHFVTKLKFNQQLVYGELMGRLLADKIKQQSMSELPECLIPIPLHTKRLRERGYNQALCIAKSLSRELAIPVQHQGVNRSKATQAQSSLHLKERINNVKNAFSVNQAIPYQHIAIIDDVMTTGQTVQEFAKCLKKAGVKKIEVWCAARA